tara:strand:+ start:69 stop:1433 length:1365 start_codon:yes stop_codon:yes gene_type:complete
LNVLRNVSTDDASSSTDFTEEPLPASHHSTQESAINPPTAHDNHVPLNVALQPIVGLEEMVELLQPVHLPVDVEQELNDGIEIVDTMLDLDYLAVTITPDQLFDVASDFLLTSHVSEKRIPDHVYGEWEFPVVISSFPWIVAFPDESEERPLRRSLVNYLDHTFSCCPVAHGSGFILSQRHVHTSLLVRALEEFPLRVPRLRVIRYGMKLPFLALHNSSLWAVVTSGDASSVFDLGRTQKCEEIILFKRPVVHDVENVEHYPMLWKMGEGAGGSMFSTREDDGIEYVKVYSEFVHRVKSHSNIQFDYPKRVRSLRGKQNGLINFMARVEAANVLGGFRVEVRLRGTFINCLGRMLEEGWHSLNKIQQVLNCDPHSAPSDYAVAFSRGSYLTFAQNMLEYATSIGVFTGTNSLAVSKENVQRLKDLYNVFGYCVPPMESFKRAQPNSIHLDLFRV